MCTLPSLMELRADAEKSKPALIETSWSTSTPRPSRCDELHKTCLTYYRTPTGQKMIASEPMVNGGMLAAARDWGTRVAFKLNAEAAAELQGPAH